MMSLAMFLIACQQGEVPAGWTAHVSKDGRYAVQMPSEPIVSKKTSPGQFDFMIAEAEGRHDSVFVVTYCDFPAKDLKPDTIDKRLDQACKGTAERFRGKIRSEMTIKLDGHPGREIVIEKDGAVIAKMRIYLVERRLYQVMVLGGPPIFSPKEKDVGIFLDSFRLSK